MEARKPYLIQTLNVSTYPVSAYLYRSVNMQTDDESFNTTIVTLIILDQLCFMGFTNLFISAIGKVISVKGAPLLRSTMIWFMPTFYFIPTNYVATPFRVSHTLVCSYLFSYLVYHHCTHCQFVGK